jgi:hypothetical protein
LIVRDKQALVRHGSPSPYQTNALEKPTEIPVIGDPSGLLSPEEQKTKWHTKKEGDRNAARNGGRGFQAKGGEPTNAVKYEFRDVQQFVQ